MKRLVFLFTLCLVVFGVSKSFAQQPLIKILANSTEVTGNLALHGTQRLNFVVSDGKPANAGYAYEFGAIRLIPATGAPIVLKTSSVENHPSTTYSLRSTLLQTYPQGFKIRLDNVTRHNPNHTTEVLPFAIAQLEINVIP